MVFFNFQQTFPVVTETLKLNASQPTFCKVNIWRGAWASGRVGWGWEGSLSYRKTVHGRRDALWENLHTVLCTMELSLARWADSVCVCVCYDNTLERPLYTVNASAQWNQCGNVKGCQITLAVQKKKCLFLQKTADPTRDQRIDDLLKKLFR